MANLTTSYMGIPLKNPIIAGASRLTGHMDSLKRIETAGVGAVVIKSLFEEQIEMERYELDDNLTRYDDQYAEMLTIYPHIEHAGPEAHLLLLQKACDEISIPVFASLNAVHKTTWLEYARIDSIFFSQNSVTSTTKSGSRLVNSGKRTIREGMNAGSPVAVSPSLQ